MEDICILCTNIAKVACSCDIQLSFCSDCFLFFHENTQGKHDRIKIDEIRKKITQEINSKIKKYCKIKAQVIAKSNQLMNIIQKIAFKQISFLKKNVDICKKDLKNRIEKVPEEYKTIKIREIDLRLFEKLVTKIFSLFKDDNEIIENEENKFESFLKNEEEVKKKLQTNLKHTLEGHTTFINSLAVTSDNKYAISCSNDQTIRI